MSAAMDRSQEVRPASKDRVRRRVEELRREEAGQEGSLEPWRSFLLSGAEHPVDSSEPSCRSTSPVSSRSCWIKVRLRGEAAEGAFPPLTPGEVAPGCEPSYLSSRSTCRSWRAPKRVVPETRQRGCGLLNARTRSRGKLSRKSNIIT